jgi:peroxiredoxin
MHATIIAVSSDKEARQASFRREIGAEFSFVADPTLRLIKLFESKTKLLPVANRTTFVIGKERKILHVESGRRAIDPSGAAQACSLY